MVEYVENTLREKQAATEAVLVENTIDNQINVMHVYTSVYDDNDFDEAHLPHTP